MLPRPRARYTQLTIAERQVIRQLRAQNRRMREIADILKWPRSTIYREVRRNKNAGDQYYEVHAQTLLRKRRLDARTRFRIIDNDLTLEAYVEKLLRFGLSPEQIAGYMRRSHHERTMSYRTMCRWIRRAWVARKTLLRFRGKPRALYGSRKNAWDPNKRHISERPRSVQKRDRVGDWEADLVHGTQDDSRHCLLTLNDRATGFCIIRKITAIDSTFVAGAIINALAELPVRTITCDNGFEFGRHKFLERKLKCRVYFTDVNSPQQRGSNENLNGLVRQFFPKGRSMRHVTQSQATEAATRLNGRPRKRFGYVAPRRLFAAQTGRSTYFIR